MARLTKQDKADLLAQTQGKFFRPARKKKLTFEEYLEFLTVANAFANHKRRLFRLMTGDNFKL